MYTVITEYGLNEHVLLGHSPDIQGAKELIRSDAEEWSSLGTGFGGYFIWHASATDVPELTRVVSVDYNHKNKRYEANI